MANHDSTTTFGASIVATPQRPKDNTQFLSPSSPDSPLALSPTPSDEDMNHSYNEKPIPPHSPFYQHPPASFEKPPSTLRPQQTHSRQNSKNGLNVTTFEKDLEGGYLTPQLTPLGQLDDDGHPFTQRISIDPAANQECKMWPSRQTLMQTRAAEKKRRREVKHCAGIVVPVRDRFNAMSKKQKLASKAALGVLLIGVAVAIGVGISVAVHGSYYSGNGQAQVGGSS